MFLECIFDNFHTEVIDKPLTRDDLMNLIHTKKEKEVRGVKALDSLDAGTL